MSIDAMTLTDYTCPNCHKRYRRIEETAFRCCVRHGPKDCCHAFEQRIAKRGWPLPPKAMS